MTPDAISRQALARGVAEQRAGRSGLTWFRLAACAAPSDPGVASVVIAGTPQEQGRLARRALCLDPTAANIWERFGSVLVKLGAGTAGEASFRRALVCSPEGTTQSAFAVADLEARRGATKTAYPLSWWVAQQAPTNPGVLVLFATIAGQTGRHESATAAFAAAADLLPENATINLSAALAAWRTGHHEATQRYAQRACLLSASEPSAMALLNASGNSSAGEASTSRWAKRTIAAAPLAPASWRSLAEALIGERNPDGALAVAKKALMLDPLDRFSARSVAAAGLATVNFRLVRRVTQSGLINSPGDPELSYHLAQAEKSIGDLGRGWDLEADRDTWPRFHRIRGLPRRLLREPLPADGLLIATEQGIGDELMFLSCLPDLLVDCPKPVVEADPRLHPLFSRSFPGLQLVDRQVRADGARALFDYTDVVRSMGITAFVFAGDLAARYRRHRSGAAARHGYLTVDPAQLDDWRKRVADVGAGSRKVVGLAWSSQMRGRLRARYNYSLDMMLPLVSIPDICFVCLQYTDCREELADFRARHDIDIWRPDDLDQREDLDRTAALMAALDLVVSTDTSACMLAAAAGCHTLRLGSGIYSALDEGDLFFSNMEPMIGREEPRDAEVAITRATHRIREWLAADA